MFRHDDFLLLLVALLERLVDDQTQEVGAAAANEVDGITLHLHVDQGLADHLLDGDCGSCWLMVWMDGRMV